MSGKGRFSLGIVDQSISSLSSVLLLIAAARSLPADLLGQFVIGTATVAPCISIVRAMCGETLLVRIASSPDDFAKRRALRRESTSMLGFAVVLAVAASCIVLLIALVWSAARPVLLASAVSALGVVVFDAVRHHLIALRKTLVLVLADFVLLVLSVGSVYLLGLQGVPPERMILAWGGAAALVAAGVLALERLMPDVRSGLPWSRTVRLSSSAFVAETILGAAVGYLIVIALAWIASDAEVAAYRAALSVFGVTSLMVNFLRTMVLRELQPRMFSSPRGVWLALRQMGGTVVVAVAVTVTVVVLLPADVGSALLGESWAPVAGLAFFAAANRIAAGASVPPMLVLRTQGVTWSATRVRIAMAVLALALCPWLASLYGARGALLAESLFYAATCAALMRLALRETKPASRRRGQHSPRRRRAQSSMSDERRAGTPT
ncbi:hypothetical protein [Sinomonas cyclohexanicum]|uniref:hypothetical protein n=1 Tax=Sinomonas cyclohexanicum TaxID=322009 RepID=UPI001E4E73FD|nr:hypothetical protein [Corynebacterium cyclohexanicum]